MTHGPASLESERNRAVHIENAVSQSEESTLRTHAPIPKQLSQIRAIHLAIQIEVSGTGPQDAVKDVKICLIDLAIPVEVTEQRLWPCAW